MGSPKRISVANELEEVANALTAARLLSEELADEQLGTEEDTRIAPRAIAAVINIAIARMNFVTSALRGTINPRLIYETYNQALERELEDGDGEVTLVEWGSKRQAK